MILKKLEDTTGVDGIAVQSLEDAIAGDWKSVYPRGIVLDHMRAQKINAPPSKKLNPVGDFES